MLDRQPVGVALIGVGYWGPNLLRNLAGSADVNLVAVVDLDESRREFVARQHSSVKVTADIADVVADPAVEAVVVATPADTHADLAVRLLTAGKHILVEKPLATSVSEVDRIADAAGDRVVMAGHTFLFNPAVRYLKAMIDAGDLGEIRYITSQRLNLGRVRSDVDAWWNLAPHDVSIVSYLLDDAPVRHVRRVGGAYLQDRIDDVVFATLEYETGVLAHLHVSWLDPLKVRKMVVVGSQRMAVYDDVADDKIAVFDKGIEPVARLGEGMDYDLAPMAFNLRQGDVRLPLVRWEEPLKLEIDHFIACVRGEAECWTGLAHARRVVDVLERAGHAQ